MKIILFGGAFNPVHNEHVAMLKAAISAIGADKVIIMPTAVSPHKTGQMTASPAARLEMCRLAFSDLGEVSDFEVNKGGASYSYITCEYLRHKYPDDEGLRAVEKFNSDMNDIFSGGTSAIKEIEKQFESEKARLESVSASRAEEKPKKAAKTLAEDAVSKSGFSFEEAWNPTDDLGQIMKDLGLVSEEK